MCQEPGDGLCATRLVHRDDLRRLSSVRKVERDDEAHLLLPIALGGGMITVAVSGTLRWWSTKHLSAEAAHLGELGCEVQEQRGRHHCLERQVTSQDFVGSVGSSRLRDR